MRCRCAPPALDLSAQRPHDFSKTAQGLFGQMSDRILELTCTFVLFGRDLGIFRYHCGCGMCHCEIAHSSASFEASMTSIPYLGRSCKSTVAVGLRWFDLFSVVCRSAVRSPALDRLLAVCRSFDWRDGAPEGKALAFELLKASDSSRANRPQGREGTRHAQHTGHRRLLQP
jgi:hypothetical protein